MHFQNTHNAFEKLKSNYQIKIETKVCLFFIQYNLLKLNVINGNIQIADIELLFIYNCYILNFLLHYTLKWGKCVNDLTRFLVLISDE